MVSCCEHVGNPTISVQIDGEFSTEVNNGLYQVSIVAE